MSVNLSVLKDDAQLASGDPVFCDNCKAAFNMYSKIGQQLAAVQEHSDEDAEEHDNSQAAQAAAQADGQVWVCEFCSHSNAVVIDSEEVPDKDAINYVIEGGEDVKAEEEDKQDKQDHSSLIFCIDISGSMNRK